MYIYIFVVKCDKTKEIIFRIVLIVLNYIQSYDIVRRNFIQIIFFFLNN